MWFYWIRIAIIQFSWAREGPQFSHIKNSLILKIADFRDELDLFFCIQKVSEYHNYFWPQPKMKSRSLLCSLLYPYIYNSHFLNDCVIYFQKLSLYSLKELKHHSSEEDFSVPNDQVFKWEYVALWKENFRYDTG